MFKTINGKQKKRAAISVFILLPATMFLSACGGGTSALIDRWSPEDGGSAPRGFPDNLELFKDGTGAFDSDHITWKAERGRLMFNVHGDALVYDYKVSGSKLTLTNDGGISANFVNRKTAEAHAREREIKEAEERAAAEREREKEVQAARQVAIMSDNESGAIANLRTIGSSQVAYSAVNNGNYGTLEQLIASQQLGSQFRDAINGYRYVTGTVPGAPPWWGTQNGRSVTVAAGFIAEPVNPGVTGRYRYGVGADLVVRYMEKAAGLGGDVPNLRCGNRDLNAGDPIDKMCN